MSPFYFASRPIWARTANAFRDRRGVACDEMRSVSNASPPFLILAPQAPASQGNLENRCGQVGSGGLPATRNPTAGFQVFFDRRISVSLHFVKRCQRVRWEPMVRGPVWRITDLRVSGRTFSVLVRATQGNHATRNATAPVAFTALSFYHICYSFVGTSPGVATARRKRYATLADDSPRTPRTDRPGHPE